MITFYPSRVLYNFPIPSFRPLVFSVNTAKSWRILLSDLPSPFELVKVAIIVVGSVWDSAEVASSSGVGLVRGRLDAFQKKDNAIREPTVLICCRAELVDGHNMAVTQGDRNLEERFVIDLMVQHQKARKRSFIFCEISIVFDSYVLSFLFWQISVTYTKARKR